MKKSSCRQKNIVRRTQRVYIPAMSNPTVYDLVVLGAGASGLLCAAVAAERDLSVLLVDHSSKAGRKLSITGGGKCNLTNRRITPEDYAGENPRFCRSALSRFTPQQMMEMAEAAGIELEEREHGQMFCRRSAKDLVSLLWNRCRNAGCRAVFDEKILRVESLEPEQHGNARYLVRTAHNSYYARNTVVALGSPAWPQVGGTGTAYEVARAFGHRIVSIRPALVGLTLPDGGIPADLSGIAVPASIRILPGGASAQGPGTAKRAGKKSLFPPDPAADNLPLLFTHKGISGPAALQASLYRTTEEIEIDFLPGRRVEDLLNTSGAGKSFCRSVFKKLLPDRLCAGLLPEALGNKKIAELSRAERQTLADLFHAHRVRPIGTEGFSKAEIAAGGISTEDISSRTMESKRSPGLYFCGEALDVSGRLGGYNLHWAFASGCAAGNAVGE